MPSGSLGKSGLGFFGLGESAPDSGASFTATANPGNSWYPAQTFTATASPSARFLPLVTGTFQATAAPKSLFQVPGGPLPTMLYGATVMDTGQTLVYGAAGTQYGNYRHRRQAIPFPPASSYQQLTLTVGLGISHLPSAVYGTTTMAAGPTLVWTVSGTAFGQYARVYKIVVLRAQSTLFFATAAPQCSIVPLVQIGTFTAAADPLAFFVPGNLTMTADPLASFAGINDAYTAMSFQATAEPQADFTPEQLPGFLATAEPTFICFPIVGQSEGCSSGTGADNVGFSPRNAAY